jgi:hypothetical protein
MAVQSSERPCTVKALLTARVNSSASFGEETRCRMSERVRLLRLRA